MKRNIFLLPLLLYSCMAQDGAKKTTMPLQTTASDSTRFERYTGSLYKDNYLWGGAMNLCWTELCNTLLHGPLELETEDKAALLLADRLNHPVCTIADLDEPSYYMKAGFGPKTLDQINSECRAKFPQKSFDDLKFDLAEQDMISYAYFFKKVAYEKPFMRQAMVFQGQKVAGFTATDREKQTIEVLRYGSDQQFIIRIRLRDAGDELLLAKGYDTRHPSEVLQALEQARTQSASKLGEDDFFKMPLLKLKCRRDYFEAVGKRLKNERLKGYVIGQMFENFAFELDETGAKVENEAVLTVPRGAMTPKNRRYFYLDQPFWVIMKRSASPNPYFMLGVNNTAIMLTE